MSSISLLPSAKKLHRLPARRIVAYAVRCARRVESLFCELSPDRSRAEFMRNAIEFATRYVNQEPLGIVNRDRRPFQQFAPDQSFSAACYAMYAADEAIAVEQDPDYDWEAAKDDESTIAHRAHDAASLAWTATHMAREIEMDVATASVADYKALRKLPEDAPFDLRRFPVADLWPAGEPPIVTARNAVLAAILSGDPPSAG